MFLSITDLTECAKSFEELTQKVGDEAIFVSTPSSITLITTGSPPECFAKPLLKQQVLHKEFLLLKKS